MFIRVYTILNTFQWATYADSWAWVHIHSQMALAKFATGPIYIPFGL
jgi:hypothetical protein